MSKPNALNWSSLGSIGSSPVSKLAILMPFVGYLILLQDKVVPFLTPFAAGENSLEPKLSVGFYLLYFGLFIFGIGSFGFHITCPSIVKRFSNADEYVERVQALVTATDVLSRLSLIIAAADNDSDVGREAKLYRNSVSIGASDQISQAIRIFTLRAYFEILDQSVKPLRVAVFLLFAIGITLTSIPSLIALVRVSRIFFATYF